MHLSLVRCSCVQNVQDMDRGYFLYMVRQVESGAWTEEQAEAFMTSLYDDDGPYS